MQNLIEDYKIMNLRQMAEKYGVSAMTIRKRLRKLGIDTSYKRSIRPDLLNNRDVLKEQISNGKSLNDIAKLINVDKRTVEAALVRKSDDEIYYCSWNEHFVDHHKCSKWLLKYGFKHPQYSNDKLIMFMNNMLKVEPTLNANYNSRYTMNFIRHFSNYFYYSTHKDYNCVADAWRKGNQIVLKRAVEMMWNHGKICNIFNLVSIIARHFRDFTTVSIFKPWVASYIYDKYMSKGGVVVDPCMGWGGRLLGCIGRNIKYYGVDLNNNSVEANLKMSEFIINSKFKLVANISRGDSSIYDFPNGDLLFTSPPYDDTEHYYGIDSSATRTDLIYDNIFKKFENIIVLNIPRRHEDLCVSIACKYNRKLIEILRMNTNSFMGREKTYEPIMVFK